MYSVSLYLQNATEIQMQALQELAPILNVSFSNKGIPVTFAQTEENQTGYRWDGDTVTLFYHEAVQLFRALGLLVESCRDGRYDDLVETPWHTTLAPMIDCSRNQVHNTTTVKQLIRHLALMGYNGLLLYTEDTYEIPELPYFGYMRGRYSAEEIREIDRYCLLFGIELIPCIQVLAHLNGLLRWNTFKPLFDTNDILLVDDPKTYALIDLMLKSVASMFSSRRINVGMDEAFLLGRGKYLDIHGYESRTEIMHKHLDRVIALCHKYGLKPMMWSDMFFSTAADGSPRQYYDTDRPISDEVYKTAPKDVSLVYWDYYHEDVATYDNLISQHKKFDNDIYFAGGAWRWKGFAPSNEVSFQFSRSALESCRKNGIKNILLTAWAESAECALFSVLPVFQLFAEDCYRQCTEETHLQKRLMTCAQADLSDFMALDLLNRPEKNPIREFRKAGLLNPPNPCRYILWQDILQGLYDKHVDGNITAKDFSDLMPLYDAAAKRNPQWSYLFRTLSALADVLSVKAEAGIALRRAYMRKDRDALCEIADSVLPEIIQKLQLLQDTFYQQWIRENKIFGYDILDMRFGGLNARLYTAQKRIHQYLAGELSSLAELEEEILCADCRDDPDILQDAHIHFWSQAATVSIVNS